MRKLSALAASALVALTLSAISPVAAQAPAKIQIVVFGFPSLGRAACGGVKLRF